MNAPNFDHDERTTELLVLRALAGLEPEQNAELENSLLGQSQVASLGYDDVVASLHLALVERPMKALPHDLKKRLDWDVESFCSGRKAALAPRLLVDERDSSAGPHSTHLLASPWLGWTAAAACLLAAFFVIGPDSSQVESARAERSRLVAEVDDEVVVPWTVTEDPSSAGAAGDVVWSDNRQQGFMTIRGLERNDPAVSQYQLWIFDSTQPEATPIDGGVFDIGDDGEVVVPIVAKLAVSQPYLFAVTVEGPGGVVVSKRERIALVASIGG